MNGQVVHRGNDLALCEVAGGPEEHHRAWLRDAWRSVSRFVPIPVLPPGSPVRFASFRDASTLYLNTAFSQFGSQLLRIFVVNDIHAQAPRILQIERAVVDKNALRGRALRNF